MNVVMKRNINLQEICRMKIYFTLSQCYALEVKNVEQLLITDYEDNIIQRIQLLNLPDKLKEAIVDEMNIIEEEYFISVIEPTIEYN